MMVEEEIVQRLLSFIQAHTPLREPLDATTDLLEAGILDSLMVADLFVFIETHFGVVLRATDISPQNFRSIQRLVQLVLERRQRTTKAA